jgi:hypothetical protein
MHEATPESAVRVVTSVAGDEPLGTLEPLTGGWLARPVDGTSPLVLDDEASAWQWLVSHSQRQRYASHRTPTPPGWVSPAQHNEREH